MPFSTFSGSVYAQSLGRFNVTVHGHDGPAFHETGADGPGGFFGPATDIEQYHCAYYASGQNPDCRVWVNQKGDACTNCMSKGLKSPRGVPNTPGPNNPGNPGAPGATQNAAQMMDALAGEVDAVPGYVNVPQFLKRCGNYRQHDGFY